MKPLTVAAIALLATIGFGQMAIGQINPTNKVSFKRAYIGQPQRELLRLSPDPFPYMCWPGKTQDMVDGESQCEMEHGQESLVNTTGIIQYWFLEGMPLRQGAALYKITGNFPVEAFSTVSRAFVEKYGAPASRDSRKLSNAAGGTFDMAILGWKLGDVGITLQTFHNDYGRSDRYQIHRSSFVIVHLPTQQTVQAQLTRRSPGRL